MTWLLYILASYFGADEESDGMFSTAMEAQVLFGLEFEDDTGGHMGYANHLTLSSKESTRI